MTHNILILEDEPHIVESLSFLLERAGFRVRSCSDGTRGLALLRAQTPDLLILDIMLPGMSGLEILRSLRQEPPLDCLPVMILTAKGQERDRVQAEALGANTFLSKPFDNAKVVAAAHHLIKQITP